MTRPNASAWLASLEASALAGRWTEIRARTRDVTPLPPAAAILVAEAELRQGDFAAARDRLEALAASLDAPASRRALIKAKNMLGVAYCELGALDLAEAQFDRALDLAARHGDHLTVARATNNLGIIANQRGRHEAALALYRIAVPAFQRLGFARGLGETHHNLAITLRDLGQLDEADRQERRAITFAEESDSGRLLAMARAGRAEISLRQGEPAVAAAGARLAAAEYAKLDDPVGQADALRLVGLAAVAIRSFDEARHATARALDLASRHGSPLIEAETLGARARLWLALGDPLAAEQDVTEARAIFDRLGVTAEREALDRWWSSAR